MTKIYFVLHSNLQSRDDDMKRREEIVAFSKHFQNFLYENIEFPFFNICEISRKWIFSAEPMRDFFVFFQKNYPFQVSTLD